MPEKPIIQPGTRAVARSEIVALCGLVPNIAITIGGKQTPPKRKIAQVVDGEEKQPREEDKS